jgi:hypothetical protein
MLFSPKLRGKPGPEGPSAEFIHGIIERKKRNPDWDSPRIAPQVTSEFHIPIDKDVVRRVLAPHHRSGQHSGGPSWQSFLGHRKDNLSSMDLFRYELATLRAPDRAVRGDDRWCGTWSDVQPRHARATRDAEFPPLRQASALSVSPRASPSRNAGADRNQDRPLCSPVPSVRGEADRHHATRVLGSHIVLDDGSPRKQVARLRTYFHIRCTHASREGRTSATSVSHRSHISARLDGHATVEPYSSQLWLPDVPKTRAGCGIQSASARLSKKSSDIS